MELSGTMLSARYGGTLLLAVLTGCSEPGAPGIEEPLPTVCTHLAASDHSSELTHSFLWTIDTAPPLSAEQQAQLSGLREMPTTAEVHVARLSPAADSLLHPGSRIVLTMSPGRWAVV